MPVRSQICVIVTHVVRSYKIPVQKAPMLGDPHVWSGELGKGMGGIIQSNFPLLFPLTVCLTSLFFLILTESPWREELLVSFFRLCCQQRLS